MQDYKILESARARQHAIQRLHHFEILDSVFKEFVETNTCGEKHYTLKQLVDREFFNSRSHKYYFSFQHLSIPYLATLFQVDSRYGQWLNIKLINNGFFYRVKDGECVERHNSETWIESEEAWEAFTSIQDQLGPLGYDKSDVKLWYNFEEERVDIKIYSTSSNLPNILITFEPGIPDMEERKKSKKKYEWKPRK